MQQGEIQPETSQIPNLGKKIGTKIWFILSALMNAISLINIGRDLKITFFKWVEFFTVSFELIKKISEILLAPFIVFLGWFDILIPAFVKNLFFFGFLLIGTFGKAWTEKNKKFKLGALKKEPTYPLLEPIALTIFLLFLAFCAGIILSIIGWIGYIFFSKIFIYLIIFFLLICFYFMSFQFGKTRPETQESNSYFKLLFRNYLFTVIMFVVLLCLVNYFIITFGNN